MRPTTIPQAFRQTVERHGARTALLRAEGDAYRGMTYRELDERVRRLALGLIDLGVEKGDRVGLISENRPEWAIADLAILSVGAVNTPVFPTLPAAQLEALFRDAGARVVVVSDAAQLAKMLEVRDRLPALERVIVFDAEGVADDPRVLPLDEVGPSGAIAPERAAALEARLARLTGDDLASITYTSGTTDEPKGVMLTHDNLVFDCLASLEFMPMYPEDRFLSFLPLNHVFERLAGYYMPIFSGSSIAYAESIVKLTKNLTMAEPTVLSAVPRVYQTVATRIEREAQRTGGLRGKLALWALRVAREWGRRDAAREAIGLGLSLAHAVADRLVYPRVRTLFGGKARLLVAGGAPLLPTTGHLFHGMGFMLLEGYGLTETSPVITCNPGAEGRGGIRFGTVGIPLGGIEVRIAEDGEVLTRGRHVMRGYWGKPEMTAEVIDGDGWFHTGDIGRRDAEGYLSITDRKKDLLVLANGKKVAPAPIEGLLRTSPLITDAVLLGDNQDHVTALVIPDFPALREALTAAVVAGRVDAELVESVEAHRAIGAEIRRLCPGLADYEKVRKFRLLARELSVEAGELTPTLKVKRRVIVERYATEIADMAE